MQYYFKKYLHISNLHLQNQDIFNFNYFFFYFKPKSFLQQIFLLRELNLTGVLKLLYFSSTQHYYHYYLQPHCIITEIPHSKYLPKTNYKTFVSHYFSPYGWTYFQNFSIYMMILYILGLLSCIMLC